MNSLDVSQYVKALYEDAVRELLVGLNCDVNMAPDHEAEWLDAPVAIIDAGSEEMEVTVALELPMTVLAMTYPVPSISDVDDEALEDWISEMANQLIGRLKTKLIKHQQEVVLGLPSTTFGIELDELIASGPMRFSNFIEVDGQACAFHLGLEFYTEDIGFASEPIAVDGAMMESEIELF